MLNKYLVYNLVVVMVDEGWHCFYFSRYGPFLVKEKYIMGV